MSKIPNQILREELQAVDLFEHTPLLPSHIKKVVDYFISLDPDGEGFLTLKQTLSFNEKLERLGYTFDVDADCQPFFLRIMFDSTDTDLGRSLVGHRCAYRISLH